MIWFSLPVGLMLAGLFYAGYRRGNKTENSLDSTRHYFAKIGIHILKEKTN